MTETLSDADLARVRALALAASPGPWRAMIEGRDHLSGDSFIRVGPAGAVEEDLYLVRDSGPADDADLDFVAAARTVIIALLDEVEDLRSRLSRATQPEGD